MPGMNELLRVGEAAQYLGVTTGTIRRWEASGRLLGQRVGWRQDRRFCRDDLELMRKPGLRPEISTTAKVRREALYIRVSGRGDQMPSLESQEKELRASAQGKVITVYRDVGSGFAYGKICR